METIHYLLIPICIFGCTQNRKGSHTKHQALEHIRERDLSMMHGLQTTLILVQPTLKGCYVSWILWLMTHG